MCRSSITTRAGRSTPDLTFSPFIFFSFLLLNVVAERCHRVGARFGRPAAKKNEQGDAADPAKRVYAGLLDCFRKTWAEGLSTFYLGFPPSILRAIPVNGAIFTGFTAAQRALA